jgi:hypothetical protein
MVVIVRRFPVSVEYSSHLSCLPSVEELRPSCCPLCQEPARTEDGLRIVGHGTYRRQLLGVVDGCGNLVIWIRRFLCRRCQHTISVQPDDLYPGRWYAGVAIVLSLVLSLLGGESDADVRERVAEPGETRGWKTLERWRRQLLSPMWSWLARQLGVGGPPGDRKESRRRLQRLLSLHGVGTDCRAEKSAQCAQQLVIATAHVGSVGFEIRRGPPSDLSSRDPRRARM